MRKLLCGSFAGSFKCLQFIKLLLPGLEKFQKFVGQGNSFGFEGFEIYLSTVFANSILEKIVS